MKNIEKYTNTKDALEAYNKLNPRELFETWLECEYEEPRQLTLLEAAKEIKGLWDKAISSCQSIKLETWNDAIDRLSDAAEREKRKPVRNCDVGTSHEQAKRFHAFCKSNKRPGDVYSCDRCKLNSIEDCELAWAQMPYEEGVEE